MNENAETQQEYFGKTMETCKEPCKLLKDACLLANKANELQEENRQLKNDYEMIHNCFLISENEKKELEAQIEKMKKCANCNTLLRNDDIKYCKNCPNLEGVRILRH